VEHEERDLFRASQNGRIGRQPKRKTHDEVALKDDCPGEVLFHPRDYVDEDLAGSNKDEVNHPSTWGADPRVRQ
jgi:hypothetical protein